MDHHGLVAAGAFGDYYRSKATDLDVVGLGDYRIGLCDYGRERPHDITGIVVLGLGAERAQLIDHQVVGPGGKRSDVPAVGADVFFI